MLRVINYVYSITETALRHNTGFRPARRFFELDSFCILFKPRGDCFNSKLLLDKQ
jgi:hypothetical protein